MDPELATPSRGAPDDTHVAVRRTYERSFEPGQIVFDVDQPGNVLYVVQSGRIELQRPGSVETRVVARLGPGDLFGEMGALVGAARSLRAVAAEPSRLLELDRATFEAMCLDQPEIALGVIQRLAGRVIALEKRLAGLGIDDLLRPVVRSLLRRAERGTVGARVHTTLRQIADDAGFAMLEAHRALQSLFERRLIRLVDDTVVVPDLDALAASLDDAEGHPASPPPAARFD